MDNLIAEFTATFENRKHNLAFDVQDGTAYLYFVTDGLQIAEVAKLLLLKGKGQCFKVRIYEDTPDSRATQDSGHSDL